MERGVNDSWLTRYETAARLARDGDYPAARMAYAELRSPVVDIKRLALVGSDLGTLDVLEGNQDVAVREFTAALCLDHSCEAARENLQLLQNGDDITANSREDGGKVAIVSFLFNWPSTGGGIVHTVELAEFLQRAGFDVKLICFQFEQWSIGNVDASCPFPVEAISFDESEWTLPTIGKKIRAVVDRFVPDAVIVTDAWNIKPYLTEALQGHRVFLRMQAQECLCPLNNLRFRPTQQGFTQCGNNQLSGPQGCRRCVVKNAATSGQLHRLERELCGVGTPEYHERLLNSLQEAEAVLVLNPQLADAWKPFSRRVEVVTWGMAPERFPAPLEQANSNSDVTSILFAGLTHELIKGFHVLCEACTQLWQSRQDFELVVTDQAPETPEAFARYVGWHTQLELPRLYRETDITVVPTIVQDGLSRTSVESMASGKPVVASRIGGLPFTVADGETGLLFEPGNGSDLAEKLGRLLDDGELRKQMGNRGRQEFEDRFRWPDVIQRNYIPLLRVPAASTTK